MDIKALKFTEDHEWVRVEGKKAYIGISEYAQKELGDIVYVDLPPVGERFAGGDELAEVESVKAVSNIFCPLSGEVLEVNEELTHSPELINKDPYGQGWIAVIEIENPDELNDFMDAEDYDNFCSTL
ncbi:MAG TPA: glycine cleavage system protein GcvH [Firmicutes bacterium]|jgi:glycine cleavage system H protein|nr:glycine cleavage system protein GcvH [Bacillota bacterium]HAZ21018.1 glycine cleavage system protein GcvH [Bacillota bacterium]HBL51488.1 glycine cleavage system protein GcvH [Bacillota bacterium]HCF88374.1 glycine cleavage system protein GcvH [Bacillota bacterium]HCF91594.1 glycine cleavage system protein GcvH [Bacillota bacterium]